MGNRVKVVAHSRRPQSKRTRHTYYAHIAGTGWIRDINTLSVSCTPYFDKAMPLLVGALEHLPDIVSNQYRGYRLRILKVEHDAVTDV